MDNFFNKCTPTQSDIWQGRQTPLADEYWYQVVQQNVTELPSNSYVLLGYACDEGVKRNQGRVGAVKGPEAIRRALAKFPVHFDNKSIVDVGDMTCVDGNLEQLQEDFSELVKSCVQKNNFTIALGGGHDIAYAHGKGLCKALEDGKHLGIINLDAHFDLRPVDDKPNSGTPFNQLLAEFRDKLDYLPIGIQTQGNTKSLFQLAEKLGVDYIPFEVCTSLENIKTKLDAFVASSVYLYITIDMDAFSSAIAPGVSAANPVGLSYAFVEETLSYLLSTGKVIALDVAEMNPTFDRDNQTAKLAARLVDFCVHKI